jgi:tripartite-type tricarboxylate transporter receptor subunit TctC
VRVIVPVGPGGGLDFVARLIAPKLSESLGQTVVIDNRAGASGNIGVELAAQAAPDGYTLIFLSASSVVSSVVTKTRFDLMRDFAPVSLTSNLPTVLAVHPSLPANSVSELIAYAKANPRKLNYGSTGNGTILHLAGALFALAAGIEIVHVPYKSVGAATVDLLAGQIQLNFANLGTVYPHVKAGRLRMLAVTSQRRTRAAPDLPTMIEAGLPGFVLLQWHGMLAPAAVPRVIIERLHREITSIVRQPATLARLEESGIDAVASTPQEFAAYLKNDHDKWAGVIRQTGIRLD